MMKEELREFLQRLTKSESKISSSKTPTKKEKKIDKFVKLLKRCFEMKEEEKLKSMFYLQIFEHPYFEKVDKILGLQANDDAITNYVAEITDILEQNKFEDSVNSYGFQIEKTWRDILRTKGEELPRIFLEICKIMYYENIRI